MRRFIKSLKNMAVHFFSALYSKDVDEAPKCPITGMFSPLSFNDLQSLSMQVTDDETKRALFDIGPFKAPGPDGYQALFYQSQWEIVGLNQKQFVSL